MSQATTDLDSIRREIEAAALKTEDEIEQFRVQYLGRKAGRIRDLFARVSEIPPAERKDFGQAVNELKQLAEERLEDARKVLASLVETGGPKLDLTLPARRPASGSVHPISQTLEAITNVFRHFGFEVAEGPEMEDDWHNFTALNFPPDHPARDMQDTLFVELGASEKESILMRTHTSPVQIRIMEKQKPPIRIIMPGRVYRNEALSYKSFCLFHQVEGLYVDEGVTFAELKKMLHVFARVLFGSAAKMRFRPSFFPFTEPSAEVDIWWASPDGSGKWLEILGCGMVDPNVLEAVGIDSERFTGYAFGMGVERIAMLRHNIEDIRLLYENDIRLLEQF